MRKILVRTLLALLLICVLATVILSLPVVQTRLAKFATNSINEKFDTHINIDRLRVSLITWDTSLRGVYIEDYRRDTLFYINELTTSVLSIRNMVNGKLEFGDIEIDQLQFNLKTYAGEPDTNLGIFIDKLDDKQPRDPGTPPFYFSSSNVDIADSHFRLIDENLEREESLNFKNLNISASDFLILGPEVTTEIHDLSLDSNDGLSLERLSTSFKYTKQQMRFDSLEIKTPQSELKGNVVFDYNREDFQDFLNKVHVTAEFNESTVALDEVNLLYNEFGSAKTVNFSSSIQGFLNDLEVTRLFLQSDNTGISGDFRFRNLFSSEQPFILNADIRNITTSYYQLRALLPNILGDAIPSTFQQLGQFTIRGDATITETSIDSRINLNCAIGKSFIDLDLTEIDNIDNASYTGFVSLIDFDLGKFVNNRQLGVASMDLNVEGKGFVSATLNTEVIGEVYSLVYNGYQYQLDMWWKSCGNNV